MLGLFTYTHASNTHALAYIRYFEPMNLPTHNARNPYAYTLPYDRFTAGQYDFVELNSILKPAHVIPNFDTVHPSPTPQYNYASISQSTQHPILSSNYSEYFLCTQHFPLAV